MRRERAQEVAAKFVGKVDRRLRPYWRYPVWLDHPPTADNTPRYGYGRPRHRRLEAILARHEDTYRQELEALVEYIPDLLRIQRHDDRPGQPRWINNYLPGLDTVTLYGCLRRRAPRRYLEVGSGNSTMVARRAKDDGSLATEIVSIDPHPRAEVDALCDKVIRRPLEQVDPEVFADLGADDVLFVDASHRVFMNSDMVAFYMDILPELPAGLTVGIHDILWPDDYLPEWSEFWFSEQYLFGAYLLAEAPWIRPLLASNYACQHPDLSKIVAPLFDDPRLAGVDRRGFTFWFAVER